jgi:hypothetical protein
VHKQGMHLSVGDAAEELELRVHQVRRLCDQLWDDLPRIAGNRVLRRDQLSELATAAERRYGKQSAEASA